MPTLDIYYLWQEVIQVITYLYNFESQKCQIKELKLEKGRIKYKHYEKLTKKNIIGRKSTKCQFLEHTRTRVITPTSHTHIPNTLGLILNYMQIAVGSQCQINHSFGREIAKVINPHQNILINMLQMTVPHRFE